MVTEHNQTLKALQFAIQMEIDGKEYYLKTSQKSRDELGRKLLSTMAAAENIHRQRFEAIYDAIRAKKVWPVTKLQPANKGLKTIFAEALSGMKSGTKGTATELEAVKVAIGMETKSYDYYKSQGKKADYGVERGFYEALAAEEQEHHLVLLDYYEYLSDPAAWFVKREHPSLDGG